MRVEVEVTADDIAEGTACSECCCPVALAVRRALGRDVRVGALRLELLNNTLNWVWDMGLPHAVQQWIRGFDNLLTRADMEPFKFTIEIPESMA